MADPEASPALDHSGSPRPPGRLLTVADAAAATGLSQKALRRRVDRGTLRAVHDEQGRRMLPRAELIRAELLSQDGQPGRPGGELIVWREIAERERARAELAEAQAVELRVTLAGIAQAGPIRALRLRRALRSIPADDGSRTPAAGA